LTEAGDVESVESVGLKKRYPLEPLLDQREREVDARVGVLRDSMVALSEAERARAVSTMEREDHEVSTSVETRGEADRCDAGGAVVEDLACLHTWLVGRAMEAAVLVQRERAAFGRERQAMQRTVEARSQLAEARAGAKMNDQQREKFLVEQRRVEERKQESEAEDLVNAQFAEWSRRKM